jgi:acetylglutamate kinase
MEPVLIKISGNVVDDDAALLSVLKWAKTQHDAGVPVVVVHGGGRQINDYTSRMGIETKMVDGRRITDTASLDIITGVLGGIVNKSIVSRCRDIGLPSCGISGIDGNLTTSHKRPPLMIKNEAIDFGLVGEVDSVDVEILQNLLQGGFVPVVGCLTWSEHDGILNINADTFSNKIAAKLKAATLYAIMDVESVLDKNGLPLATLNHHDFHHGVQEGWISAGMIPKLSNAFKAIESGVQKVVITNAVGLTNGTGTHIY